MLNTGKSGSSCLCFNYGGMQQSEIRTKMIEAIKEVEIAQRRNSLTDEDIEESVALLDI